MHRTGGFPGRGGGFRDEAQCLGRVGVALAPIIQNRLHFLQEHRLLARVSFCQCSTIELPKISAAIGTHYPCPLKTLLSACGSLDGQSGLGGLRVQTALFFLEENPIRLRCSER